MVGLSSGDLKGLKDTGANVGDRFKPKEQSSSLSAAWRQGPMVLRFPCPVSFSIL